MSKISDSINPHELSNTKLLCFWALDHLEGVKKRFGFSQITECLVEEMEISVSKNAVRMALNRARGSINKNKEGFRLMQRGRQELASARLDETIFIEAGHPFFAKRTALSKIFKNMNGTVKICDPFLDQATLDIIFQHIDKKMPMKILTKNIVDKPSGALKRSLGDLQKEGFTIEVRIYGASAIHDRYILDDASMWLSGNSLNCLGNKESFIVKLGADIAQSTRALFDSRWKASQIF